jgi:hypothetical protein
MVSHTSNPSYTEVEVGGSQFKASARQKCKTQRAGDVTSAVEHLPSKHEAFVQTPYYQDKNVIITAP